MKIINGVLTDVGKEDIVDGKFIIPEGVTDIGKAAFSCCSSLTSINIPESVTSISYGTFAHCSSLTSINIPKSVTDIGKYAFSGCISLTSINIPKSVTSIGKDAFSCCSSLTSINIPESVTIIGEYAFSGCSSLASINIPKSVTSIGNDAFSCCSSLTSINIPESVTSISYGTFAHCSSLTSINIPKGVTSIGCNAFVGCISLTSIDIPESVTNIEVGAFVDCISLTSINIPESVTSISYGTFIRCSALTSINIPESVTSIGEYAFSGCSSLASINIPKSVTSISDGTFSGCISLTSIDIPESILCIEENAFSDCNNLEKLVTPWGEAELKRNNTVSVIQNYLYLYANHLLKEKYTDLDEFMSNQDIHNLYDSDVLLQKGSIQKFKNIFYKMRKQYDVDFKLLSYLKIETTEEFDIKVWNQIKNTFEWRGSEEMTKAFAEMIEVFGLFHKDSLHEKRIETFQKLFRTNPYRKKYSHLIGSAYDQQRELIKGRSKKVEVLFFKLKNSIEIPDEFSIYLKSILSEEEIKRIKKISGTYGRKLKDFVKENYEASYHLKKSAYEEEELRNILLYKNIFGQVNYASLHRIFDGCNELYDENFYEFFIENLLFILNDEKLQSDVKNIQKHFKSMEKHYLFHSGIKHITLKQAVDYINNISFDYHKGNYELMQDVKKAGVVDQEAFNYYQSVYEKNDIRRMYSLVRRSTIYEINGYTIKAELLRKDDSFSMLVGEKNYTNCCQVFGGVGHNCMAHAVNSSDGGIFVTRLLKDGKWILLTESWDWQNNNLYCHDNIEGTEYFNHGPYSLKEAVAEVIRRDGEYIIEKSKDSVGRYIESRRRILEKSISPNKEKELEELRGLENREVIRLVTCGSENDDLGVNNYFKTSLKVNQNQFIKGKQYTLSQFQPVNYNSSQIWFDQSHSAYSDATDTQVIIAGSIEELCLGKQEPLVPIYREDRRIVLEEKDSIRDYTINKIMSIEKEAYPEIMRSYEETTKKDLEDSHIYLGEDWYLVYEERGDSSIYISDLARVDSTLEDEKGKQNEEMMEVIYDLVRKYEYIEADLKEDTSYLLYLMNKRLGYFEQIGGDISYPFKEKYNTKVITEEEQESMLKRIKEIREKKNPELMMHKVRFKKGRLLSKNVEKKTVDQMKK